MTRVERHEIYLADAARRFRAAKAACRRLRRDEYLTGKWWNLPMDRLDGDAYVAARERREAGIELMRCRISLADVRAKDMRPGGMSEFCT